MRKADVCSTRKRQESLSGFSSVSSPTFKQMAPSWNVILAISLKNNFYFRLVHLILEPYICHPFISYRCWMNYRSCRSGHSRRSIRFVRLETRTRPTKAIAAIQHIIGRTVGSANQRRFSLPNRLISSGSICK